MRPFLTTRPSLDRAIGVVALVLVALGPLIFSAYWVSFILTQTFWLGIAAMSMIFLSAYGGMVSLGQVGIYGVAGIVLGNVVTTGQVKGLHLGWSPWLGLVLGISIATAIAALLGALASRSVGIYFLMLTLTFGVLIYYFFSSVTSFSGFSGISGIQAHTPHVVGDPTVHPNRLYYIALVAAFLIYAGLRYLVRTPFGLTLQGIRDDPIRMSSLGYNVALHRATAFAVSGFIASIAGVLFVWWNDHVDPTSFGLGPIIDLLIVGVIGSLYRLEGAWVGAFAFILINNYTHDVNVPVVGGSFNTVIGVIFLAIVLLSPSGLLGIWEWLNRHGGQLLTGAIATARARPAVKP
jgi:branched-chain amino acid transport system permease protein